MKKVVLSLLIVIILGYIAPQATVMPVKGASTNDFNKQSFWFYPWGKSVTHKGIDIFAKEGTEVVSAASGFVLYTGNIPVGGNVVLIIGTKWRLFYYAHLQKINTHSLSFVLKGTNIAAVGNTGNAVGKPPHLHYSVITLFPYLFNIDSSVQGWKKAFYLNPSRFM